MQKYVCTICGYVYDEAVEKVKFQDLPETWKCPLCSAPKSALRQWLKQEPRRHRARPVQIRAVMHNK